MKWINSSFTLLMVIAMAAVSTFAQNPERTKKIQKSIAKRAKTPSEVRYQYTPHEADNDGDGVQDIHDKCPGEGIKGKVTPFGCPIDTDFDGVYDDFDSCVTVPGLKALKGCPIGDRDSDGIKDDQDICPDLPGIERFRGCPDTDGDGIQDSEDACPKVPGVPAQKGCPEKDTDGDGVLDRDDLCPTVKGVRENRGCPPIKEHEKIALKKAFDNLLFETGKDVIVASSFPSLNELAEIMKKNAGSKLHLEGHTDNVGEDYNNMDLSQRRAESVKMYLRTRGVDGDRIYTAGYGETRPKASNDTESGRKQNRRVEFNLSYE